MPPSSCSGPMKMNSFEGIAWVRAQGGVVPRGVGRGLLIGRQVFEDPLLHLGEECERFLTQRRVLAARQHLEEAARDPILVTLHALFGKGQELLAETVLLECRLDLLLFFGANSSEELPLDVFDLIALAAHAADVADVGLVDAFFEGAPDLA
jgi:hypothetical protein